MGPYQGMYSDYVEESSMDFKDYKWYFIDAKKTVETELGKYYITSNTISGKTMQSTTQKELIDGTSYEQFDEDGKYISTITSNGSTLGPSWQIRNSGDGYFANGNIEWDSEGKVTFSNNVKLSWNSNIDDKPSIPTNLNDVLDEQNNAIIDLNIALDNIGTDASSVLSPSMIAQLALTATEGTSIDESSVKSSWILGMIGTFGSVKAERLTGTTIEGKNIQSSDKINDIPIWKIDSNGAGHLAGGNICWEKDGDGFVGGTSKDTAAISWTTDDYTKEKEVIIGSNNTRVRHVSKMKVIENINLSNAMERLNPNGLSLKDLLGDTNIAYSYNKLIITGIAYGNDGQEINENDNLLLNIDMQLSLPILGDEFEIVYSLNGNSIRNNINMPLKINYASCGSDIYGPNGHQEIMICNGSSVKFIRYTDQANNTDEKYLYTISGNWKPTI